MELIEMLLALVLLIIVICYNVNRILGLPPGPVPLPIIGNTFQIPSVDPDKYVLKLRHIYGDVFTLWMPFPTVVISSHDALKRTFIKQGDSYAWRASCFYVNMLLKGDYGLVFGKNEHYRSQRRFAIRTLNDLGVAKGKTKNTVTFLIHRTVDLLRKTEGAAIEIRPYLTSPVGNVVGQLCFGCIRPVEDQHFHQIQALHAKVSDFLNDARMLLLEMLPFLRHFNTFLGMIMKSRISDNEALLNYFQMKFNAHKSAIDYEQVPTNFLDCYLHELHQREKDGTKGTLFTRRRNSTTVTHGFTKLPGMDTIVATLRYALLLILNYSHIQTLIHKEIDEFIGPDKDITTDDQKILPYTCAFLQEVYRVGYVLYISFPRVTTEDVNCEGYKLPRGTRVVPQFQSVHMDENLFPRPELIIPERHLKAGQFVKDERITPFSVGKRACLGENLARMEVFMIFATLMQKFRFEPEGLYPPRLDLTLSVLREPLPFKIRVIDRQKC